MDEAIYRDRFDFHEGFLVRLHLEPSAKVALDLVPFVQSAPAPGARRLRGEDEQKFHARLAKRSGAVCDEKTVAQEWEKFCQRHRQGYLSALLGHNRVLRKLNTRGLLVRLLYGKRSLMSVRNVVSCETHREVLETIFSEWIRDQANQEM